MVILDTNIIIDHIRRKVTHSLFEQICQKYSIHEIAISIITIQELYAGESTRKDEIERALLAITNPLKIFPYTYEVAKLAGEIVRDLSRPIELADAAIASTAIINGCQLATLNKKDFQGIKDLELV